MKALLLSQELPRALKMKYYNLLFNHQGKIIDGFGITSKQRCHAPHLNTFEVRALGSWGLFWKAGNLSSIWYPTLLLSGSQSFSGHTATKGCLVCSSSLLLCKYQIQPSPVHRAGHLHFQPINHTGPAVLPHLCKS